MDAAGGVANVGCGGVRVDIADRGGWSDVYITGARVGMAVLDMGILGGGGEGLQLGGVGLQLGR